MGPGQSVWSDEIRTESPFKSATDTNLDLGGVVRPLQVFAKPGDVQPAHS